MQSFGLVVWSVLFTFACAVMVDEVDAAIAAFAAKPNFPLCMRVKMSLTYNLLNLEFD